MAGPERPPETPEQDKLRLVLDYLPCDVCLSVPSEEDQDTLCSICARLNRTIVERVVVHGEPSPADERAITAALPDPEPEPETPLEAEDEPTTEVEEDEDERPEIILAELPEEDEEEAEVPVLAEDDDTQLLEDDLPPVEVYLTESRPEVLAGESSAAQGPHTWPSSEEAYQSWAAGGTAEPPEEPGAASMAAPFHDDLLPPFTIVAPPRGSVEGLWIVPGEEGLAGGGIDSLSQELTDEVSLTGEDLAPWPGEDDDLALDLDDIEPDVEAEPEQEAGAEGLEEPDDSFWEDLLEEDEDEVTDLEPGESDVPAFESAEDWLEEPAEGRTAEALAEEDDDPFAAFAEEPAEPEAREPMTFELDEPVEAPAVVEEEDELDFEEVEFDLAEPEATAEPEEEDLLGAFDDEAEPAEVEAVPEAEVEVDEPSGVAEEWEPLEETPVDELTGDEAYTHGPYTLYHKVVETGDGETRDLYFFARQAPEDASPSALPDGYEVGVNERTGVPFVRRERP